MRFKILLSILILSCYSVGFAIKSNDDLIEKGGVIFNDSVIHEIRVNFTQELWKDSLLENKHYKEVNYQSKYLRCNVLIDGDSLASCGIRYKGESSYQFYPGDKKSFRLKLNAFVKKQNYDGIKGLSLNNNFKDPTMMREKLVLDFCNKQGFTSQRSAFVKVYVNDVYFGLYTMLENINGDFFKSRFGTKKGHLIQGKPKPYLLDLGNDTLAYKRSYTYKTMNKSVPEIMKLCQVVSKGEKVEDYINLKEVYQQFIVSNLFLNVDAYNMYFRHNFHLFKPKRQELFRWVNYDYNYSFGAWSPNLSLKEMETISPYFVRDSGDFPLWELIVNTPKYKKEYTDEYKNILANFDLSEFNASVKKYHNLLTQAVELDTMKMYSNAQFHKNISTAIGDIKDPGAFSPGLTDFMANRIAFLKGVLKN